FKFAQIDNAAGLLVSCNLLIILLRCLWTVFIDMESSSAISLLVLFSEIILTIFSSVLVSKLNSFGIPLISGPRVDVVFLLKYGLFFRAFSMQVSISSIANSFKTRPDAVIFLASIKSISSSWAVVKITFVLMLFFLQASAISNPDFWDMVISI